MKARSFRALALALPLVLGLVGCGPTKHVPAPAGLYPTLTENPRPALEPYVLQVGDELGIKFYTNPELNEDVTVRPDGMISLQLVDDVLAADFGQWDLDRSE